METADCNLVCNDGHGNCSDGPSVPGERTTFRHTVVAAVEQVVDRVEESQVGGVAGVPLRASPKVMA